MPSLSTAIQFNGQPLEVPAGTTIAELLALTEIRSKLVAVEINREIVPREMHVACIVNPGDEVEVVTLVGGG